MRDIVVADGHQWIPFDLVRQADRVMIIIFNEQTFVALVRRIFDHVEDAESCLALLIE